MSKFTVGNTHHGFTLERIEFIEEIQSTVYLFTHAILGTPALAIKNEDPNKTFCIAYQTVPEDSTGVAHILEHSVLMGSKKYPVKDVFGEINKGGLMTFLNAMTGSDTTWYPFATRNTREYFNIMDVYCDVTLNPLLDRSTFEQEGWHYHCESRDQEIQFQGVVYNEMKGAFSDPFRHLFHHTIKGLMPNSTYAHESGGDPENIPDLSFEQFVAFHKKHYHPSNAMLFFYGNADLDQELALLQDNFLSQYTQPGEKAVIAAGDTISKPVTIETSYGVQPGAATRGKTFLAVGSLTGTARDRKENTALAILSNILYNSDASPLKNAIIEAGVCHDFGGLFVTGSSYKTFMLTYLIGSDPDKKDDFLAVYDSALRAMVRDGLDPELVLAELNKYEFSVREEMNKAQRGLDLIGKALPALKYGADPFAALMIDELFAEIRREALENNYFERIISDLLLDNPQSAMVTLKPDPELMSMTQAQAQARLQDYQQSLSNSEKQDLVQRTVELLSMQSLPNDEQTLALLPSLTISDLEPRLDFFETTTETVARCALLSNPLETNAINYIDFGFDCSGLNTRMLSYLDIFATIVTEIGTEDMDYRSFAKEVNIKTGGFSHAFSTYQHQEGNSTKPILWFQLKALSGFLDQALELVQTVLSSFSLNDRIHIREIVQREFAWAEHNIQSEGYSLASTRVFSHLSLAGKYNEQVSGASAYLTLKELATNYEVMEDDFLRTLEEIRASLLCRSTVLSSITARPGDIERFRNKLPEFIKSLPDNVVTDADAPEFPDYPEKQAFATSAEVVYNVKGCTIFPDTSAYNGCFEVLRTWLSRDYLWNTVRQAGGAYGCFIQFSHLSGNLGFVSYRDPQISKTFQAYEDAWKQVAEISLPPSVLQQLIIGTYGNFDPHQGPAARGATARNEFLSGITAADKQQRINEILKTDSDALKAFAPYLKALAQSPYLATIGNGEKIKENASIYEAIIDL